MAAKSDYLENKLIDFLFRAQAFAPPATLYIGLFTTATNDAGMATEVSGGAYARVGIASGLSAWKSTQGDALASTGSTGQTSNSATVTFPAPTANWGSITGTGIFDAAIGGNLWAAAALGTPKTVNSGDPAPTFAVGAIVYQEDN